jgi:hypothetical protein
MIRKLSFIGLAIAFSCVLFAEIAPAVDMASMEPAFKNMQTAFNLEVKNKFEMLCDRLMTPGMFLPEYFTEDNMKNEITMMFGGLAPDMTEDAALFFLSYRLWERHNGINVPGMAPKNPLGGAKNPLSGPSGQVQQMAQVDRNALAFENNVKMLAGTCYQRVRMNEASGRKIRTNE